MPASADNMYWLHGPGRLSVTFLLASQAFLFTHRMQLTHTINRQLVLPSLLHHFTSANTKCCWPVKPVTGHVTAHYKIPTASATSSHAPVNRGEPIFLPCCQAQDSPTQQISTWKKKNYHVSLFLMSCLCSAFGFWPQCQLLPPTTSHQGLEESSARVGHPQPSESDSDHSWGVVSLVKNFKDPDHTKHSSSCTPLSSEVFTVLHYTHCLLGGS